MYTHAHTHALTHAHTPGQNMTNRLPLALTLTAQYNRANTLEKYPHKHSHACTPKTMHRKNRGPEKTNWPPLNEHIISKHLLNYIYTIKLSNNFKIDMDFSAAGLVRCAFQQALLSSAPFF